MAAWHEHLHVPCIRYPLTYCKFPGLFRALGLPGCGLLPTHTHQAANLLAPLRCCFDSTASPCSRSRAFAGNRLCLQQVKTSGVLCYHTCTAVPGPCSLACRPASDQHRCAAACRLAARRRGRTPLPLRRRHRCHGLAAAAPSAADAAAGVPRPNRARRGGQREHSRGEI